MKNIHLYEKGDRAPPGGACDRLPLWMLIDSRPAFLGRLTPLRHINHAVDHWLFTACTLHLCNRRSRMNLPVELDAKKRLTTSLMRAVLIYMSRQLIAALSSLRPLFRLADIYLSHRAMEPHSTCPSIVPERFRVRSLSTRQHRRHDHRNCRAGNQRKR